MDVAVAGSSGPDTWYSEVHVLGSGTRSRAAFSWLALQAWYCLLLTRCAVV